MLFIVLHKLKHKSLGYTRFEWLPLPTCIYYNKNVFVIQALSDYLKGLTTIFYEYFSWCNLIFTCYNAFFCCIVFVIIGLAYILISIIFYRLLETHIYIWLYPTISFPVNNTSKTIRIYMQSVCSVSFSIHVFYTVLGIRYNRGKNYSDHFWSVKSIKLNLYVQISQG